VTRGHRWEDDIQMDFGEILWKIELNWLRMRSSSRFLWRLWWTFRFYKAGNLLTSW